MESIKYLLSLLPEKRDAWAVSLNEILMSHSVHAGNPYNENLNLILLKYKKRMELNQGYTNKIVGVDDLIKSLIFSPDNQDAKVYPLKSDDFSGECIVVNNKIIGCAFIKRGRSFSKEGLWIDGGKID